VADGWDEAGALVAVVVGAGVPADAAVLAGAAVTGGVVFEAPAVGAGLTDAAGASPAADTVAAGEEAESFSATPFLASPDGPPAFVGDGVVEAAAPGTAVTGAMGFPPAKATPSTVMYPMQPTATIIPTRRIVRALLPDASTKTGPSRVGRLRRRARFMMQIITVSSRVEL
jgi:hypothetical protein